mmetsp:Transcript_5143/g.19234  ORF Transcript_5143/g.19234 Transcript_5143/m.19234 type:complete len:226 (-) Transcript_5143:2868-3545(-)
MRSAEARRTCVRRVFRRPPSPSEVPRSSSDEHAEESSALVGDALMSALTLDGVRTVSLLNSPICSFESPTTGLAGPPSPIVFIGDGVLLGRVPPEVAAVELVGVPAVLWPFSASPTLPPFPLPPRPNPRAFSVSVRVSIRSNSCTRWWLSGANTLRAERIIKSGKSATPTISGVAVQNFAAGATVGRKILYEYVDRYRSESLKMQLLAYQIKMLPQIATCCTQVQ